jgi:UPF0271 protein
MTRSPTAYIVDTRGFIAGVLPRTAHELYVTEGVLAEARRKADTENRVMAYLEAGRVKMIDVPGKDLDVVSDRAQKIGEIGKLSDVDLGVAAAALGLSRAGREVVVLTDDYALQNLLSTLGIEFGRLTQRGIVKQVVYRYRCTACGRLLRRASATCPDCGSRVVRVRLKERKVRPGRNP